MTFCYLCAMPQACTIHLTPDQYGQPDVTRTFAARALGVMANRITHLQVIKRSVDARKFPVRYVLRLNVWVDEAFAPEAPFDLNLQNVKDAPEVHIVGLGPAGLFAALRLIELGIRPVVIERGQPVRERRRDLALLNREGIVNPESNYCFGEGGAGTFSDGKLYTRSTKRGDVRRVLDILVKYGATDEILIDAHPHIGTNKLPAIIQDIRNQILECGGEIHFGTKLEGVKYSDNKLSHIVVNGGETWPVKALILATGHSARDIFSLLDEAGIELEAKPFALGVRVEHPQALIDSIQYHSKEPRHPNLPAASYSLVRQISDKGVYSFCMCPGGIICPATTGPEELVVNGWSPSLRNTGFANSGMVVNVDLPDFVKNGSPLEGVAFQASIEQLAAQAGGGKQVAPAQRMTDFVHRRPSQNLPKCSYLPGIAAADLSEVLPDFVHQRLRKAFRHFGKHLRGYLTNEAVVVGVESRTSCPVRIPRDRETLMHPGVEGFFPCGEGAGYAGGIMSAAIDGERCAAGVARFLGDG